METDVYFEMSPTHRICEDYALCGQKDDMSYIILSDGCSSSMDSDVGARLLSHIAKGVILYLHDRDIWGIEAYSSIFRELVLRKCIEVRQSLGISVDAFDATLLVAVTKNGQCLNIGWGDGYFIQVRDSGIMYVTEIKYGSGAPYYISYEMLSSKKENYLANFGTDSIIKYHNYTVQPDGDLISTFVEEKTLICNHSFTHEFDTEGYSFMVLSSDGIGSYRDDPKCGKSLSEQVSYDVLKILPSVVGYKSTKGEFVTRRMQRLKSDMDKAMITHTDDVSCAAIYFEQKESV